MRKLISKFVICGAILCLCLAPSIAAADDVPTPIKGSIPNAEVGVQYNFVHTNAPPGGCGCFSMNGGGAWVSYNVTRHWAMVGEVSAQHASNVDGSGQDLTLTSYLVGPRYRLLPFTKVSPFGQVLLGGSHASGGFAPGQSGNPGSANVFAMTAGGGIDLNVSRHLAIRLAQVDYYLTRFNNSVNDHQNNVRVSAGVVFRIH